MLGKCSVIRDDGNLCGEAPLWDSIEQKLYWTDSAGSKFFSFDWNTKHRNVVLEDFAINGAVLDQSEGLVLVGNSGVWLWDKVSLPRPFVSEMEGTRLQLNDCIADPSGRLITGSCFYDPATDYARGKIYSIERGPKVRILDDGFHLANGMGFSPDTRIFYFTDSVTRTIYRYTYDSVTGDIGERDIFVTVDSNAGIPDGMTVDAEGFVWSAEWYGSCVSRYDPDGKLERRIHIPAKQTSSLTFGGPELRDIFVTSAARSEPMPMMPTGYDPNSGYFGGALFHLNAGIQGRPGYRTALSI